MEEVAEVLARKFDWTETDPNDNHILESARRASFARLGRLAIGPQVANLPHSSAGSLAKPGATRYV
jgi:hypothetical protein